MTNEERGVLCALRLRAMSLLFGLLQRFAAFLIHTSMQGEGTLLEQVRPLPKINVS